MFPLQVENTGMCASCNDQKHIVQDDATFPMRRYRHNVFDTNRIM